MTKKIFLGSLLYFIIANCLFASDYTSAVKSEYTGYPNELVGPCLMSPQQNQIFIGWKSTNLETPTVYYGFSETDLSSVVTGTSQNLGTYNNELYVWNIVELNNLQPNTPYYYKVKSGNVESEVFRFRHNLP